MSTSTATRTRAAHRTATERALLWLEGFLAVGAYGGAIGLITGGVDLGAATADLPFGSTVFAGVALALVNGALPTAVFVGAVRSRPWALRGHLLVGAALVGWITVQVAFLGWPPHWLQILYFVYGWVIVALALTPTATATVREGDEQVPRRQSRGDVGWVEPVRIDKLSQSKASTAAHRRGLLAWPVKRRTGYLAMIAVAAAYTIVFGLMAWHGLDPFPEPWLRVPADRYYLWSLAFSGPALLAGWLLAAAVVQLWARALGGAGAFEDLAATLGVATALSTLATLIPDLVMNLLGIYGGPWSTTWWGWTLAIGWMTGYFVLFCVLYPRAVRAVHGLGRARSALVGISGFVLYQGFIFIFIR